MLLFTAGMAIGQNNEAIIDQLEDGNVATIGQVGTDHYASIDQDGKEGQLQGTGHKAYIEQLGLNGTGSGVNNEATVEQDYFVGSNPVFHTAFIDQWGDGNKAYVEQEGNQNGGTADMFQNGIENYAGVYMIHGNTFEADQVGDYNRIEGVPGGGAYGNEPEDVAYQQGGSASGAMYTMDFDQMGNNNLIQALQQRSTGGGESTISQTGDWNTALSFQNRGDGLYDVINITQNGYENDAVVHQTQ